MSEPTKRGSVRLEPPSLDPWEGDDSASAVAVLMSGGVDSSVSAMLLKEKGLQVVGITMRIPGKAASPEFHCEEVVAVCRALGIHHYFVEMEEAFEDVVIAPFRRAYAGGVTPNPCIACNARVKFGLVRDLVEAELGIRCLATGHYARVIEESGRSYLARAADSARDQSYFLYRIPLHRLSTLLLPLGELDKDAVRDVARGKSLPVSERDDSMELCFAGGGDYRALLDDVENIPGPIRDTSGKVIGTHSGIIDYTVGQRRGLGVAAGKPLYVLKIDPGDNSIIAGPREETLKRSVTAAEPGVLIPERLKPGGTFHGKIRSYSKLALCRMSRVGGDSFTVEFEEPQFAPTPGQHLVLYDDDGRVVAGGVIAVDFCM